MEKCVSKNEVREKDEKYIRGLFALLKKRDYISYLDRQTHFNDAEIRLLSELISAKYEGKRLISTQLAKKLGVTRSAISQIVKRMESKGALKRVADDVDRKIAYIEITDQYLERCNADLKTCREFIVRVVDKYGADKFEQMCDMVNEFMDLLAQERTAIKK